MGVLILIIVEEGFRERTWLSEEISEVVLILIIVEEGFRVTYPLIDGEVLQCVLILIIVEEGFRVLR